MKSKGPASMQVLGEARVLPNSLRFAPGHAARVFQAVTRFNGDVFELLIPKMAGMLAARNSVAELSNDQAPARFSRSTVRWVRAAGATGEWLPAARVSERGPDACVSQASQLRAIAALALDDRASGPRRRHTFGIRVRDGGRGAQLVFASRCSQRAAASASARVLRAPSPLVTTSSSGRRATNVRLASLPPAPPPPPPAVVRKRGRRGGRRAAGEAKTAAGVAGAASGSAPAGEPRIYWRGAVRTAKRSLPPKFNPPRLYRRPTTEPCHAARGTCNLRRGTVVVAQTRIRMVRHSSTG